jgi:hypothetical protein
MRPYVVLGLASVLFKSYFRAGRRSGMNLTYSKPSTMLIINLIALAAPIVLIQYFIPHIPPELAGWLRGMIGQALIGLPTMMAAAIIITGIMFELGQGSGLSSSESVNWLPVSAREYVAGSAISIISAYSLFFTLSLGVTLPLALEFGLMHVWGLAMALSALSLLLGAFFVEILRAAMNRISTTVYRRSGRLGIISRLVLLIVLFAVIQLSFNPNILNLVLNVLVSGVEVVWFIPVVWPSVAIIHITNLQFLPTVTFSILSVAFVLSIFEVASNLRLRYWSPTPVSIVFNPSVEYIPQSSTRMLFGFKPLEIAIARKEFRALVRRKEMARFLAIPVMLIISFSLPTLFSTSAQSGSYSIFFMAGFIPFLTPLLLSIVSVGQEGRAIINICMLPISVKGLIKGKLLPVWVISGVATVGAVGGFEVLVSMSPQLIIATIVAGLMIIVVEGFIGLGVGSRYPDYTVVKRYVTAKGFLIGFLVGGAAAIAIFAPVGLYLIFKETTLNLFLPLIFNFTTTLTFTVIIGGILSYFAYRYCKRGINALTSNLEL